MWVVEESLESIRTRVKKAWGRLCCKGQERYQSGENFFGARKNPQSTLENGIQVRRATISWFNDIICNCVMY